MNGLDDIPMQAMEERVRDAFRAAAGTVTAQDLPSLPTPAGRSWAAWSPRAWALRARTPALVPAAAAACVAVIIVTATLVVPKLLAGSAGGSSPGGLAGAPAFFVGVAEKPPGRYPPSTVLNIYRSATGRVVASSTPPGPDHMFAAVSRLGGDRTFVAAAVTSFRACTTQLYRFSIDARGRPSRLTPLSVPQVTGTVGELVGSADGNVLAYTASGRCAPHARLVTGVIHLTTGHVTTWTYRNVGPLTAGSLSLTADGSVLGFVAGPTGPPPLVSEVWVLPTNSPAGPLTRHARKVLRLSTDDFRAVLNSTGSRVYVETMSAPHYRGVVVLGLYDTTTGKRIRLLGRLGPGGQNLTQLSVSVDAAGQHLLAYGYEGSSRVTEMNLTTGHLTSTTAAHLVLEGALSTAAW